MREKSKQNLTIFSFLLPALILYTAIMIFPIIQTVYQSFFSWNGIAQSPMVFNGLDNYRELLTSKEFLNSLKNVGIFLLFGFLVQMPISFVLALFITSQRKFRNFFKTAYFIPVILPMTAIGIMWTFILWPNGGLLNTVLSALRLDFLIFDWLGMRGAPITVPAVNTWVFVGQNMLIFAAGIVAVPTEIYEAASIDGATGFKKLFYVTIPMLKNTFKVYAVLCLTGSMKVFDIVYVMTSGGPNGASDVPSTLLYYSAFRYQKYGFANSIGTAILLLGLGGSILINRLLRTDKD